MSDRDPPAVALIAEALQGNARATHTLAAEVREHRDECATLCGITPEAVEWLNAKGREAAEENAPLARLEAQLAAIQAAQAQPDPVALPAWVASKRLWLGGGGSVGVVGVLYVLLQMLLGSADTSGGLTHTDDDDGSGALAWLDDGDRDA